MNAEWSDEVVARASLHAALAEPARLAIVEQLVLGDAAPVELGRKLGLPSNLLAHHVGVLERAGLVERTRSEGDRRRSYLRLRHDVLEGLMPTAKRPAPRIVFICTHNSARSQLAAALWKRRSRVPVASAGTEPAERVHPLAVAVARRHGLSLSRARPTAASAVVRPGDLVVAVCDNAHESMADWEGNRLHWSVPDPARAGTEPAFEQALTDLDDRVRRLVPAVHVPEGNNDD